MPPRAKKKTKAEAEAEANAAILVRIRESLKNYYPGRWAEERGYGPACHCGLRGAKEPCTRHGETDSDTGAAG